MKDDTISRTAAVSSISDLLMLELKGERLPTYNEVYRAIYDLPPAQPDHIGEVTEMVGDAVSRQGVLRLLNAVPSEEFATKAMLISGVNALPSTQPDVPDTNVGDMISRQAAIENSFEVYTKEYGLCDVVSVDVINELPSAQPEYERVSAEDVAVSIAPTKLASAVWLYGTLTELEKAGYVICRKMT